MGSSAEKHAILFHAISRDNADQYVENKIEATFFERALVGRTFEQLEDDADFTVAAYSHDLATYQIAALQLDYLKEIGAERGLPMEDRDSEDAGYRLRACLDTMLAESDSEEE